MNSSSKKDFEDSLNKFIINNNENIQKTTKFHLSNSKDNMMKINQVSKRFITISKKF